MCFVLSHLPAFHCTRSQASFLNYRYYVFLVLLLLFFETYKHVNSFLEREDVDRRQFCHGKVGVSGVPRGPYCMCKPKMAACALRIKCCVLEICCSFDGSFPSRSTWRQK